MHNRDIDSRIITKEWLSDKILSRSFFCKGQVDIYETAKKKYIEFRNNLNQKRAKSGQPPLNDYTIREIIDNVEGVFNIKKIFKQGE